MEKSHIVARFDEDLDKIKTDILDMGELVLSQLHDATETLTIFDADMVDALIAKDRRINGMHKDMYTRVERVIALRQPVALDLRQALAPLNLARELERIGDHAKSTAKRARKLTSLELGLQTSPLVFEMSDMVQEMLTDVLVAYTNNDTELAAKIRNRDPDVDRLNKAVFKEALKQIKGAPEHAETFILAILLARNFERAGDHVVNMARHVHQIVTSEDLKASD
ncbi:MAG: phosphate transport system protein [Paracoccaceae bacterium]|jgi:phosphate transport system protein